MKKFLGYLVIAQTALVLGACSSDSITTEAKYPTGADRGSEANDIYSKPEGIFGEGGIFGSQKRDKEDGQSAIGVNSFLWRAALDTVSFMPLASADPFGGVILTDWYTPAENTNERLKVNVFILSRQLRSDGLRVRVFKQEMQDGKWVDVDVADQTALELEDTILTRARQLRVASN